MGFCINGGADPLGGALWATGRPPSRCPLEESLKWNRWRDVGQAGSLRATQRGPRLPPLSAAIAAVGLLTIGRSLPSCPTGAPPACRTTLLMNRVDVHSTGRPGDRLRTGGAAPPNIETLDRGDILLG